MSTTTASKEPGRVPALTLGWRLKMALDDMKASDMADALGVDRGTVSRWMNDRGAAPRSIYVKQWALMTGVDAGWLLTGETENPRPSDGPNGGGVHRPRLELGTHWFSTGDADGDDADVIAFPQRDDPSATPERRHSGAVLPFPLERLEERRGVKVAAHSVG